MDRLSKDEWFSIGILLDIDELLILCDSNPDIDKNLCQKDAIWLYKIKQNFSGSFTTETLTETIIEILKQYKGDRSWRQYYTEDLDRILIMNPTQVLYSSSLNGRLDLVILAIGLGADPGGDNNNLLNTLDAASLNGHLHIVEYLLSLNIYPSGEIADSMILSSNEGILDSVKYLAEYLIKQEPRDPRDPSLLTWFTRASISSAHNNHKSVTDYLRTLIKNYFKTGKYKGL